MFLERGENKSLGYHETVHVPPDYFDYDHIERLILQAERLKVKQDQQDEYALLKLASELKKQIPAIPDTNVEATRAWLNDPANQTAIQAVSLIDLSDKQLKVIPPEITALVNLQSLNLGSNQISEIPAAMAALENLQRLYLCDNQISEIPVAMAALRDRGVIHL